MMFLTTRPTSLALAMVIMSSSFFEVIGGNPNDDVVHYSDCGIDDYYSVLGLDQITNWDKESIGHLLRATHRTELPYTHSTKEDVWDALMDLDAGDATMIDGSTKAVPTVKLIYKNSVVPAIPYGTTTTWNREHLWPKSRGVETSGPDMTDIHHLRPSDWVRIEVLR
jgi:hypothetical protein